VTDKQHCESGPTTPELDDEVIYPTPHRALVAAAGRLARAEQQRLEKELGLQNGRTPRPG
jgi:hypothetical protein